jgi:uncharacterized coiled-coil DUF342 family protein
VQDLQTQLTDFKHQVLTLQTTAIQGKDKHDSETIELKTQVESLTQGRDQYRERFLEHREQAKELETKIKVLQKESRAKITALQDKYDKLFRVVAQTQGNLTMREMNIQADYGSPNKLINAEQTE